MNYYNEIDPQAAQWLRNLISAGHIPAGDVDERSIEDVAPNDLRGYTQCHFFAGIGGWPYALDLAGWPRDMPVWTGSCPCQPFSQAGKGAGVADERHLWPAFHHLIRECRPVVVFGEQVASAIGHGWLDLVSADLEAEGYAVGAAVLGAHSVGAPHIRQRLYWVADAAGQRRDWKHPLQRAQRRCVTETPRCGSVGDSERDRLRGCRRQAANEPHESGDRALCAWNGEWRSGADGKARLIEPGIEPLANGLQRSLELVRSIENCALMEIEKHGSKSQRDASEVMRMVREAIQPRADWEAQPTGVREQLHAQEVLFDFLLCLESARNGAANKSGFEKASNEIRSRIVRGVRNDGVSSCASRQWQPNGQLCGEFANPLLSLPFVLARLAETHREESRKAHAASGRVTLLRAYGNAIVPQTAAAFIRAYLSAQEDLRPAA